MAASRSRPGSPAVRKTKEVGPDYPEGRFRNPYNGDGLSAYSGDRTSKTIYSPTTTPHGLDIELNHDYDKNWEGK